MLFNSLEFLLFLPTVVVVYFLSPYKWRWLLLLVSSYYFYMCWKPEYVLLIAASTLVDYFAAIRMSDLEDKRKRRKYLYLSLAVNLGILFGFKYFNFFSENIHGLLAGFNIFYDAEVFKVLLPVGISFYTFQTMSYSIDVYNGKVPAERHLGRFALYVSFFPQLVAGPIERSFRLLPQFKRKYDFDYERTVSGLRLILWGFFKKMVIADRLAIFVDTIYNNPEEHYGIAVVLATVFFAFQIYCDFSGYTDIAIGTARILGIDLMKNFKQPYFSFSFREFWTRWHISLSSWFRDYVYIPLGGNRVVAWRWYYNLMLTFLISGFWHGAAWNFIIWGALHGFYLLGEKSLQGKIKLGNWLQLISVFSLTCFAWVFFRAETFPEALRIIKQSFDLKIDPIFSYKKIEVLLNFINLAILITVDYCIYRNKKLPKRTIIRWALYLLAFFYMMVFGIFTKQAFIYFQF